MCLPPVTMPDPPPPRARDVPRCACSCHDPYAQCRECCELGGVSDDTIDALTAQAEQIARLKAVRDNAEGRYQAAYAELTRVQAGEALTTATLRLSKSALDAAEADRDAQVRAAHRDGYSLGAWQPDMTKAQLAEATDAYLHIIKTQLASLAPAVGGSRE